MKKRDLRVIFTISGGWAGRTPFSGAIAYRSPVQLEGGWIDGNCSSTQWNATRHEGLLELNAGVTTIGGGQSTDYSPFYGKSFVTGVDLSGSTIRNIGEYTFYGCSGLEYMEIPEQITSIGDYAFYCANLSEVVCRATTPPALGSHNFNASSTMLYVPAESVEAYRADEDWSASVLRIYPIGYEQKYIRYNAESAVSGAWLTANTDTGLNEFDEETGEGVLYLNSGVTTIGGGQSTDYSPFYNKTDLASVDISESGIATIGDSAFRGSGIASIDLSSATSVGTNVFRNCTSLVSATLPSSLTTIDSQLFRDCSSLASITIPSGVTEIKGSAFNGTALTSVTIPSRVAEIRDYAFNCASLTTVTCQAVTPPTLGEYNFPATDTLYVPMEGYEAYRADEDWASVFTSIRPQGYTYITVGAGEHGSATGSGWYQVNAYVIITATADEHYHFDRWNDGSTSNPRAIIVGSTDTAYTATFAIDEYTLVVTGDAHTTVTGSGTYGYGSEVEITATPDEHYHFTAWSDGNTNATRTITVTENITLSASSEINEYTLTVSAGQHGTATGSGTYPYGTQVQISATADTDYHFAQWNDGNTDNPRTVVVSGDATYTASFESDAFTVTITGDAHTAVTGSGSYPYGTQVQISATPDEHYHFVAWSDGDTNATRTITVTGNITLSASSAIDTYTLTVTGDAHTTVSGSGTYDYGTEVEITATPDEHYHFTAWSDGNTNATRTITMTSDVTLSASSAIDTYTITVNAGQHASAWGSGTYGYGTSVRIYAEVDTGYEFSQWNDGSTSNPRNVIVSGDATYTATIEAIPTIKYNAETAVSGNWVTNNTDTTRNTYDSTTGDGVLYLNSGVTTIGGGTSLDYSPFIQKSDLVSVEIGGQITTIGNYAFYYCSGLEDYVLPDGIPSIGDYAFYYCSGLTSIYIPNSVTTIGNRAFYGCSGLGWIEIPDSVTTIGNRAFANCSSLAYISVASGNTTYNDGGYGSNCIIETSTNTLVVGCNDTIIPNSVTTIGSSAFDHCSGLTSITIPNSVTTIGDDAFYFCTALTSATIGSGVTSIGINAFSSCRALTSITIPNSVTTIGNNAFYGCSAMTTVTIGSGVTSINVSAFGNCPNLTTVTCNATTPPTNSGSFNFDASNDTLYVPLSSLSAYTSSADWGWRFTSIQPIGTPTDCIIYISTNRATGDWVTANTDTARNTYDSTTHLGILYPKSGVTKIGGGSGASYTPFKGDTGLTYINFRASGVTTLGAYTCNGCTNLVAAYVGENVVNFGEANDSYGVFEGCTSLFSVGIGNSVTLIGKYAFYQCSALTTLAIPSSVTAITQSATGSCSNLKTVYCYATTPPTLGTSNFPASNDTLRVPYANLNAYKNDTSWKNVFTSIVSNTAT